MENYVRLTTFSSEIDAEIAKATLAAAGIEVFLKYEDTGGMIPVLQQAEGVALYVSPENLEEAKLILSTTPTDEK